MARRVFDPRQQGARISWGSTLFQQVDRVPLPAYQPPEPLPVPDVNYITIEAWHDALRYDVSTVTLESWHS